MQLGRPIGIDPFRFLPQSQTDVVNCCPGIHRSNIRLTLLIYNFSGFAVNGETRQTTGSAARMGQLILRYLTDGWSMNRPTAVQPMNYAIKSPMLGMQKSNLGLTVGQPDPTA